MRIFTAALAALALAALLAALGPAPRALAQDGKRHILFSDAGLPAVFCSRMMSRTGQTPNELELVTAAGKYTLYSALTFEEEERLAALPPGSPVTYTFIYYLNNGEWNEDAGSQILAMSAFTHSVTSPANPAVCAAE